MYEQILQKHNVTNLDSTNQKSFDFTVSLSMLYNVTDFIYMGISSNRTHEQTGRSTIFDKYEKLSVLSNIENSLYVYLIPVTGLLIIFMIVSIIFITWHCKSRIGYQIGIRHEHAMHYKKNEKKNDQDRMNTHVTNQKDDICSQYDIICIDSDDSESNACFQIDTNQQNCSSLPLSSLDHGNDADDYQCPISSATGQDACSREFRVNDYLTVV